VVSGWTALKSMRALVEHKKRALRPLALPFLEQFQIHLRRSAQYFLQLSERAQAFLDLFLQLAGTGIWRTWRIARTDGERIKSPVALPCPFSKTGNDLLQRTTGVRLRYSSADNPHEIRRAAAELVFRLKFSGIA